MNRQWVAFRTDDVLSPWGWGTSKCASRPVSIKKATSNRQQDVDLREQHIGADVNDQTYTMCALQDCTCGDLHKLTSAIFQIAVDKVKVDKSQYGIIVQNHHDASFNPCSRTSVLFRISVQKNTIETAYVP